jgi:hypothetical protein
MSGRRNVKITVETGERDSWADDDSEWFVPLKLVDLPKWASEMQAKIPLEFRHEARLEIGSRSGYDGDHSVIATVCYVRPETDAEMNQRLATERYYEASRLETERREYERLRAKFAVDGRESGSASPSAQPLRKVSAEGSQE